MEILLTNFAWMAFNLFLACIPVFLGNFIFKIKSNITKLLLTAVWFFFLPNSIYLVTDIVNLLDDIKHISGVYLFLDVLMFLVLIPIGIITYILAVYPLEKIFVRGRGINHRMVLLFLNFFVGFGVVLGRVLRVNSWEIVTDFWGVVAQSILILRSVELSALVIVFAVFCQIIYIKYKNSVIKLAGFK